MKHQLELTAAELETLSSELRRTLEHYQAMLTKLNLVDDEHKDSELIELYEKRQARIKSILSKVQAAIDDFRRALHTRNTQPPRE